MLVFEYRINKKKKACGVKAMSIVEEPAIEVPFLTLSKEEVPELKLKVNVEQKIITGPVMIPDIKIYRSAKSLGLSEDGFIFFTKDTIKKASEMFLENELMNNTTLEHDNKTSDIKLVESWITIDAEKDKASALGFNLPVGTWMCSYKVNNEKLWEQIKAGEFKGFSIEADNLERVQLNADKEVLPDELKPLVLAHLKKVGQTKEQLEAEGWELMPSDELKLAIESDPNAESKLDRAKYLVRFYYKGPRDDKNRPFCAECLDLNLWYRKEDIDSMSFRQENPDFGTYSIFKYEGSYGCRHTWDKNYFSKKMIFSAEDEELTEDEILNVIIGKLKDKIVKK